MKKYTTEDFIKKAVEIHGRKYDYSKTVYTHSKEKVIITCPIHGDFTIRANHHLNGIGCHKCAKAIADKNHALTSEQFIKKAISIHGDTYNYDKVKYVNTKTPVSIICKTHGEFLQKPTDHLQGCNCPKCSFISIGNHFRGNVEDFIKKAKEIHGNKYDYSLAEYKNFNTKVCIICPEHGEFWQTPCGHISNREGCPACGREAIKEKRRNTKEYFIDKAEKKHKGRYDYSKVKYENTYTKVEIICSKHGSFFQTPKNHMNGVGCPKCNRSKMEGIVIDYLTSINIDFEYQKRFPKWLKYQSLDFYLPTYNVAIECQGAQHFFPVPYSKKSKLFCEELFKKQVERDNLKRQLCKENNVTLMYINYNENVEEKLKEILYICDSMHINNSK